MCLRAIAYAWVMNRPLPTCLKPMMRLLSRLFSDRSGNVILIFAASLFPLLALIGSGIDMGRGYLAQTRLQQACDAGTLAARKRLGTSIAVDDEIPDSVAETGQRFFNINFSDGAYGSENRQFLMVLEDDFSISGTAEVDVSTTIMQVFGYPSLPIHVTCASQLNMSNTDIMMVLDVTGSMSQTNPGDDASRMDVLKDVVRNFHTQLSDASGDTARLRFGFLPYSTNVNVGGILEDSWVVDDWDYQSREWIPIGNERTTRSYTRNWQHTNGTRSETITQSSYPATWHPPGPSTTYIDEYENVINSGGQGYYTCDTAAPSNNLSRTEDVISTEQFPFAGPPQGTQTVETRARTEDGTIYWVDRNDATCHIRSRTYTDYTRTYEYVTEPVERTIYKWRYKQLGFDVSDWRSQSNGCIEERDTYEISDYDNVDLTRALDLDIDLVPTSNDATRWRPMYPDKVFARSMNYNGTGSFVRNQVVTSSNFIAPAAIGTADCPPAARKLGTMTSGELDTYLDSLYPSGATYHDIGMIWGGRLMSPNGLFAAENADVSASNPTSRHMIFLTDGETAPLDISYSSYGLEPLDTRRWSESSALTLTQTVENRFSFACNEVKNRNIQVWVISFGTDANAVMEQCAGADRYFVAEDAEQLQQTFSDIASRMAELRVIN